MSHIVRNAIEVDLSEILRRKNIRLLTEGECVHVAKVAFERYFPRKIQRGESQRSYTRFVLGKLGIARRWREQGRQRGVANGLSG